MDQHALDVLTARLQALGYRGTSQQVIDLIIKAEDNTKERLVLAHRRQYPLITAFVEHARKRAMVLLKADFDAVRYIRATGDRAVRLTTLDIEKETQNALVVKCVFTRDGTVVKVRAVRCLAQ